MELRHLRYVEAVARHRHFTRAAEELHVAQSALSHQIKRLERELGTPLFRRTSRRVEITDAGEAVVARARRILAETEGLASELDELRGLVRGRLGIGAMLPAGRVEVPNLLTAFSDAHPGVELQLIQGSAAYFEERMRADEIELGFTLSSHLEGFDSIRLSEEQLVVALAPDDPLCATSPDRTVTVADLDGRRLVGFRSGSVIRAAADQVLDRAGAQVTTALESNDMLLLRSLAAHGFGAALMPRSLAELPGLPLETRSLESAPTLPVSLFWRADRELSPLGSRFADFVCEAVGVER